MKLSRMKTALAIVISAAVFAALLFLIIVAAQNAGSGKSLEELRAASYTLSPTLTATAQTGCLNTVENSFLSAKTGVNTGAQAISADISFNKDGVPVLAEKLEDVDKETAVTLERVLAYLADKKEASMYLNIKQVTNMPAVEELAKKYEMTNRLFYIGANKNQAPFILNKSPSIAIYMEIEPDKNKLNDVAYCTTFAESIMAFGVQGVNCDGGRISKTLIDILHEYSLRVSLYNAQTEKDFYNMLALGADNIITKEPKTLITVIKAIQAKNAMR